MKKNPDMTKSPVPWFRYIVYIKLPLYSLFGFSDTYCKLIGHQVVSSSLFPSKSRKQRRSDVEFRTARNRISLNRTKVILNPKHIQTLPQNNTA